MQSQSILQDFAPVRDSPEFIQRASQRARKDKGSTAKSSDSVDISFSKSPDFASLFNDSEPDKNDINNEQLNVSNEKINTIDGNIERNEQSNVSNENTSSANVNDISIANEVNYSAEKSNAFENSSVNTTGKFSEKSNEASDINVDENNVAAQKAVESAGAVATTSGRPLIEVIDEDDTSSDEIESLPPVLSDPPHDFGDVMDESDSPLEGASSPSSNSSEVGSRYEERSLCVKAKGSRTAVGVRQSPLLKPLSGKHVLPQIVSSKSKGLRRSASLEELEL